MVKRSNKTKSASKATKKEKLKVEEKPTEQIIEQAKETGEFPPKEEGKEPEVVNKPTTIKNPEPIIPEEVVEKQEEKEDNIPSISSGLNRIANGERIDHNHAIDLMKMIHTEHVANPSTPPELAKAMKTQFDGMALVELMFYNAQVERDFQQLGVKVDNTMFVQMEKVARELFGITLKGLPALDNPKQMVINFPESIPEKDKVIAREDVKAKEKVLSIPEPNINMPEKEKLTVVRAILSQIGSGIGANIDNSIEWYRKAFGFKDDEKKSVIFANILSRDFRTTLTNAITNMVFGKQSSDHSILGVHALLHKWLPSYSDAEIAEITQVCLAYKAYANQKDYLERTGSKENLDDAVNRELSIISENLLKGCNEKVIDAILKSEETVVVGDKESGLNAIKAADLRKNLITSYGDSDSILKDKLAEIVKYYAKPIARLSNYVDKSAYNS